MHKKRLITGLIGVAGIWLTAGLALPFVNVLKEFSPEQLMAFRGGLTVLIAFILLRGKIFHRDKFTYLLGLVVPFATLGLFNGIRYWGAGPTIIVITATPLVNFVIAFCSGKKATFASIAGLLLVLGGVFIARYGSHFQWKGFAWSVIGMIANAFAYELFARAKGSSLQKCFWGVSGMMIVGLVLSIGSHLPVITGKSSALLIGFAVIGGFLYWSANMLAFENLPILEASVLAQGETPAVIIGANLLLGEHLTGLQWSGVIIALIGAWYLSYRLSKQKKEELKDGM